MMYKFVGRQDDFNFKCMINFTSILAGPNLMHVQSVCTISCGGCSMVSIGQLLHNHFLKLTLFIINQHITTYIHFNSVIKLV